MLQLMLAHTNVPAQAGSRLLRMLEFSPFRTAHVQRLGDMPEPPQATKKQSRAAGIRTRPPSTAFFVRPITSWQCLTSVWPLWMTAHAAKQPQSRSKLSELHGSLLNLLTTRQLVLALPRTAA